jgi:hypothetical protein
MRPHSPPAAAAVVRWLGGGAGEVVDEEGGVGGVPCQGSRHVGGAPGTAVAGALARQHLVEGGPGEGAGGTWGAGEALAAQTPAMQVAGGPGRAHGCCPRTRGHQLLR